MAILHRNVWKQGRALRIVATGEYIGNSRHYAIFQEKERGFPNQGKWYLLHCNSGHTIGCFHTKLAAQILGSQLVSIPGLAEIWNREQWEEYRPRVNELIATYLLPTDIIYNSREKETRHETI